jgi:nicotinamidase-related amidase
MVPDKAEVALLLLDVINDFTWEGAELLLPHARAAVRRIRALRDRCREAGIPVIYVNDNFGRWRSDLRAVVKHCLDDDVPGRPIVQELAPAEDDYILLKPKHSGFFATTLDVLLDYLGVRTLIIVGFAGNLCVLFTANDAYLRDFFLFVPCDCCASNEPEENAQALEQMRKYLKADITPSTELDLVALARGGREAEAQ